MTKTTIYFVCPHCGREATDPGTTITHDYMPTADDLRRRPQLNDVSTHQLHCRCGNIYTWFSAREVTHKDRT